MKLQKFIVILLVFLFFSCGSKRLSNDEVRTHLNALDELENLLKKDFDTITKIMENVANFTTQLYSNPIINHKNIDNYVINDNGVMHKRKDDGKSAVFVSGLHKVDDRIKNIVYMTEPLDSIFKAVMDYSYEKLDTNIVQIYYNDRYSYNRIYPFLDVLVQYEPKIDITKFNFYYLADKVHNPEKKVVWIFEPYVDPAGRGWMISCIVPVYYNDTLQGVLGVDITIKKMMRKYLSKDHHNVMILHKNGTIIAANNHIAELLFIPPYEEHKYFGTISENTFKPESHKILNHKIKEFREYFNKLLTETVEYHYFEYNNRCYHFISNPIPEFDWILVKTITNN
ncbi:MAG: cache domain-containing protein [Ignavibacteria bacterium]|nr:cache domain-containing protein [Ignavibacteria bacterium]